MISIEAGNAYSLAVQQRAELQAASSDVSTGLGNSAEANRIVEDHNTVSYHVTLSSSGILVGLGNTVILSLHSYGNFCCINGPWWEN